MAARSWPTAFGISVAIHLAILAAVVWGTGVYAPPETRYIEVELSEPPARQEPEKQPVVAEAAAAVPPPDERRPERRPAAAAPPDEIVQRPAEARFAGGGVTAGTAAKTAGPEATGPATQGKGQEVDRLPSVVYGPPPAYPSEARTQRWEGTVRVRVLVAATGAVQDIRVAASSGQSTLDRAALETLRRWRFSPAYLAGRPVTAWVTVPVVFQLE